MENTTSKNSETLWFGKIPETWSLATISSFYELRNEKVSDKDYPPLSVTMNGIVPRLESAAKTDNGDNRKLVRKGDFAINSRSDRRGSCGVSEYDGSVSLINTVLMPKGEMHPGYYNWLFHTVAFADEFYKWGHGIVDDLWTTRWQEMKRIIIPVPSLTLQSAIADYLNDQCANIDSLIGETKAIIKEYKQWKTAIISEAVTRGIYKTGVLKTSRIEWLDFIPNHWSIERFVHKNRIRARLGWKGLKSNEYVDDGYPFLSAFNIVNNNLTWDNINHITQERYDESPDIKLSVGDILLVKDGAGIGKCARIDSMPLGEATVNSSLSVITPFIDLDYKYEYFYLQSNIFQNIIARLRNGMGVPHLTQEAMREILIPLPPLNEQKEIAAYLDAKCEKINNIVCSKEKLICDLEAYKKSLIYEVVTGKRKVV
ncbi:restriction endonuclease subunit S [[Clostridium] innocuum]|nr:restriction endonuclease subunit S [[Clostridium] innocuum]